MELSVYRDAPEGLLLLGRLFQAERAVSFQYDEGYLASPLAAPVSLSLPLRTEAYGEDELMPYFRGLLPEGAALENLCRSMEIAETDYFGMLAACGLDCIGDVIINPGSYRGERGYEPVSLDQIKAMAGKPGSIDLSLEKARLSLAGTQNKCGLFHNPLEPLGEGWYQPIGGAPSNYIVKFAREDLTDLMQVEHLSMAMARGCGIEVARTELMNPARPLICVERYDRMSPSGETIGSLLVPKRRHQEDLTQAFGILPYAKYRELEPSTIGVVADFLRKHSSNPAKDIRAFAAIILFNYLVGNCDNHLKNLSILYSADWGSFELAPAYDLVSTTYFARFSREMGMAIGRHRVIDEVGADDFKLLSGQLGVGLPLIRGIAECLVENAQKAILAEGERLGDLGYGAAPYIADDIEEDMMLRLEVLAKL